MYKGQVLNGLAWLVVVVIGYAFLIVPGLVLHLCCIAGASMGDPYKASRLRPVPTPAAPPSSPTPPSTPAVSARDQRSGLERFLLIVVAVLALTLGATLIKRVTDSVGLASRSMIVSPVPTPRTGR